MIPGTWDDEPPELPAWLPGGRRGERAREWWGELGRCVEALVVRYPRPFLRLPIDWWSEPALSEQLGALAVWRRAIDEGVVPPNPPDELEFHTALERIQERLDARASAVLLARGDLPQSPGNPALGSQGAAGRQQALGRALMTIPDDDDVPVDAAFYVASEGRPDLETDNGRC